MRMIRNTYVLSVGKNQNFVMLTVSGTYTYHLALNCTYHADWSTVKYMDHIIFL